MPRDQIPRSLKKKDCFYYLDYNGRYPLNKREGFFFKELHNKYASFTKRKSPQEANRST